jgi:radical SAM protein (TIGR01212 family)
MLMKTANSIASAAAQKPAFWGTQKRYYDFKSCLRNTFGTRVAKLGIDAGFTCPNRDGSRGSGGCVYCDGRGSALRQAGKLPSVTEQLRLGREKYLSSGAEKFIAYFQTFTNTYGPVEELKSAYDEALAFSPDIVGLSVGTRPDCVDEPVLDLLASYLSRSEVWVELGLQSLHESTLEAINRGHTLAESMAAVEKAAERNLGVVGHFIIGLPGEDREMILETARRAAALPLSGIKVHALLVLEGTALADFYRAGEAPLLSLEEYADTVADFLELTSPEVSIQRLTADGYRDIFIAPDWARNKLAVLNAVDRELARRDSWQGKKWATTP